MAKFTHVHVWNEGAENNMCISMTSYVYKSKLT